MSNILSAGVQAGWSEEDTDAARKALDKMGLARDRCITNIKESGKQGKSKGPRNERYKEPAEIPECPQRPAHLAVWAGATLQVSALLLGSPRA